jgi:hypothetical protein
MEDVIKIATRDIITREMPWFTLSDMMLFPMLQAAEDSMMSPLFPDELKPRANEMFNDLVTELARRN